MFKVNFRVGLGMQVRSKITGGVGIVTDQANNIVSGTRYYVQPKVDSQNKWIDGFWMADQEIEIISDDEYAKGVQVIPSDSIPPVPDNLKSYIEET